MAKFMTVGYIAEGKKSTKENKKFNLCMELEKGQKQYYILRAKPTDDQVNDNPNLAKVAEKWPDWKKFDVVLVTDE